LTAHQSRRGVSGRLRGARGPADATQTENYPSFCSRRIGIGQADGVRVRLGENVTAVVITDGYRGDYSTWRAALDRHVPIGALEDLDAIARDPGQAFALLQERVGFTGRPRANRRRSARASSWDGRSASSMLDQNHSTSC
jgi:hypothetical protein